MAEMDPINSSKHPSPTQPKTILVTGGAGFIGSHVCEALLKEGNRVISIDDFNDYYSPEQKEQNIVDLKTQFPETFTSFKCDIRDAQRVNEIFATHQPKIVIHIAARAGVRPSLQNPELYFDVNINGTKVIAQAAQQHGCEKFIAASSSSVYGTNKKIPFTETDPVNNQVSPYAVSKKKMEELLKEWNSQTHTPTICLRFFTVYGPRGRPDMAPYMFTKHILNDQPIKQFGDGSSKRDYTFIADIIQGVVATAHSTIQDFQIINLGNHNTVSLKEFIETIENVTGKKATITLLPPQEGDVPLTYADISKAKSLLNYEPTTSVEQGMKKFLEWYQSR